MKTDQATLKDIAKAMGVSATTVHRALQGKGRISEATREKALRIAAELGYRSNYMAASLKRKNIRFVIAFPEPTMENRYYYLSLWMGARQFLETVTEFNIESQEMLYPLSPGSNGDILQEIYTNHANGIDGLVTVAADHSKTAYFMEKLSAKGIPVVLVGADLHRDYRFCCVKSCDQAAGSMAAELLTAFLPQGMKQKIIVTGNLLGSLTMPDQYENSMGFESYLENCFPGATVLPAYNSDTDAAYEKIRELLESHRDVTAIYSCSARHTVQMCRAVTELGLQGKIKLIGNDCFPESVALLKQGVLTAIIDKKAARQSYLAMQALFNHVVKAEYTPGSVVRVRPVIVLKSNLDIMDAVE